MARQRHYTGPAIVGCVAVASAMLPLSAIAQTSGGTITGTAGTDGTLGGLLVSVAAILVKMELDRRKAQGAASRPDMRAQIAVLSERIAGLRRDLDAYRADSRAADAATREDLAQRVDRIDADIRRALDL